MKENLHEVDAGHIESSLGWSVEILSAALLRYAEKDRIIELEMEDRPTVTGELEFIIYTPDTWVWKNAEGEEPLKPEKIREILNRVSLAFWKLDMTIKEIL